MFTNILHNRKTKPKPTPKVFSDLHIECIVYELSDFDDILKQIRTKCQELNIMFMTRKFNSNKYSNDRHYIIKLPALHIFINEQYRNTIFPEYDISKMINIIKLELSVYNDKIKERQRKKEERKKYYANLYEYISSFFRSRTALEKENEKKIKEEKRLKEEKREAQKNDELVVIELSPIKLK